VFCRDQAVKPFFHPVAQGQNIHNTLILP
jgi:hypothetical protein